MKKLHLDADSLRVDSFASESAPPLRATVRGHETFGEECPGTDWITCPQTCGGPSCRPVDCP